MPENKLVHIDEFKKVLRDYTPNIEVIDVLSQVPIVLLVAPAATGRNTIIRNLIMTGKYYFVVSDTTRHPRINNGIPERDGEEYWFRTEAEFLEGLRCNEYVEAALIHEQQASGASIHEYKVAFEKDLIAITDIDIQGSDTLLQYASRLTNIFVLPPEFDEWMRRMDGRGVMDPGEKRRRLESAVREIEGALERTYFKFVVNWDLRQTSEELHEEIMSGVFDPSRQSKATVHARQLLEKLSQTLKI